MFCPNCGIAMKENYCIHCGYLRNGNFIEEKENEEPLLSYYFGKKYDYYYRNKNWIISGLLGPTYIFCHNYYLVGLILFVLDIAITMFFLVLNHVFLLDQAVRILNIAFIILNRYFWSVVNNPLYLKLTNRRMQRIKKKNPLTYKETIQDLYRLDTMLMGFKYFIYASLTVVVFLIVRGYVYTYLYLS